MTIHAITPADRLADAVDGYTAELELAEADLEVRGVPVTEIAERLLRRPDGTVDLERLARLAVVGALTAAIHVTDHRDGF